MVGFPSMNVYCVFISDHSYLKTSQAYTSPQDVVEKERETHCLTLLVTVCSPCPDVWASKANQR